MVQMSEHERVKELLSPYLDGRVSKAERTLVERHLGSCADCARDLATLRVTITAVREMPRLRAPRSFALPRTMAKQPRAMSWTYPLLRAGTAIATLLFVVTVGMDLFARNTTLPTAAPAALPPTLIAMQPAATIAPTSAPQIAAPAPTRQAETFAATSAPQALSAAPALVTATPASVAKAAPPVVATAPAAAEVAPLSTVVEPPTEQARQDAGLGGGGPPPPGAPPPAPLRAATGQVSLTPTAQPTLMPTWAPATPLPTQIARAPEPQPPAVSPRLGAYQARPPAVNPVRIAEGALAVLALALGVAAWIARRRTR
jgi:anti-sigma factor RsiW